MTEDRTRAAIDSINRGYMSHAVDFDLGSCSDHGIRTDPEG